MHSYKIATFVICTISLFGHLGSFPITYLKLMHRKLNHTCVDHLEHSKYLFDEKLSVTEQVFQSFQPSYFYFKNS